MCVSSRQEDKFIEHVGSFYLFVLGRQRGAGIPLGICTQTTQVERDGALLGCARGVGRKCKRLGRREGLDS